MSTAYLFSNIPSTWQITRLKRFLHVRSGEMLATENQSDDGIPVIGGNGLRGYTDRYNAKAPALVIGRVGALCGCVHLIHDDFWASEHTLVVYPRKLFNLRFGYYLLKVLDLNRFAIRTAQPLINTEIVENAVCAFPSLEEQQSIADYLDRETSQIDALITAKERLLELMTEKRRALITRAVTRGLNPDASMRDSEVPWLGEIPEHWLLIRAKYLFNQSALPISSDDEMVTCFRDGMVTLRKNRREEGFTNAILELGYQGIRSGQLILHSMDAFAGAIGVSDSNGKCSPEYIICDPLNENTTSHYYGHLLRTMALNGFIQASCPAVRERAPRIRFNDFGEMYLPVPFIEEQHAIVDHINKETERIDALRKTTERSIELLKERRTALIAAAVSGQIDVRESTKTADDSEEADRSSLSCV